MGLVGLADFVVFWPLVPACAALVSGFEVRQVVVHALLQLLQKEGRQGHESSRYEEDEHQAVSCQGQGRVVEAVARRAITARRSLDSWNASIWF